MSNWQRLDTKIVYQNSNITVHEDNVITPDGKTTPYGWVESPAGVYVVAVEAGGKVVLVKQLRYTTGQPSWELPSGDSDGQDPINAAKHGLETQAKLHADKWIELSGETYVWNGVATRRDSVMIAKGLHKAQSDNPTSSNVVDGVHSFTWDELKEMINTSELNDGPSITALARAGFHLGRYK